MKITQWDLHAITAEKNVESEGLAKRQQAVLKARGNAWAERRRWWLSLDKPHLVAL